MWDDITVTLNHLTIRIAIKNNLFYAITRSILRCLFSFEMIRSALVFLRGAHSFKPQIYDFSPEEVLAAFAEVLAIKKKLFRCIFRIFFLFLFIGSLSCPYMLHFWLLVFVLRFFLLTHLVTGFITFLWYIACCHLLMLDLFNWCIISVYITQKRNLFERNAIQVYMGG